MDSRTPRDAIVLNATGQAIVSREQDVDRVLPRDCQIVPTEMYFQVPLPGAERVALFVLRR